MDKSLQDFFDFQFGACGFVLLDSALVRRQRPIFFANTFAPRISESRRFYRETVALLEQHAKPVLLNIDGRIVPCMALSLDALSERISQLLGVTVSQVRAASLQDVLAVIDNPAAPAESAPPVRQQDYWQHREQALAAEGQRRDAELETELSEFGSSRLYDDEASPADLRHVTRL